MRHPTPPHPTLSIDFTPLTLAWGSGWMATLGEMRQTDHDGDYTSELGAEPHNVIPSGRMGTPKDIGGAAAFLCSVSPATDLLDLRVRIV